MKSVDWNKYILASEGFSCPTSCPRGLPILVASKFIHQYQRCGYLTPFFKSFIGWQFGQNLKIEVYICYQFNFGCNQTNIHDLIRSPNAAYPAFGRLPWRSGGVCNALYPVDHWYNAGIVSPFTHSVQVTVMDHALNKSSHTWYLRCVITNIAAQIVDGRSHDSG